MSRLRRWVVPNIRRQLILEGCIHGVAEQFRSRIRPEGNRALHNQPLLVVHDDLQALELLRNPRKTEHGAKPFLIRLVVRAAPFALVAIHGPHPAQESGALIELKLGCIGTGTTGRARLRAKIAAMTSRPWIGRTRIGLLNTTFAESNSLTWAGVG